jgi:hypothetical protein
MKTSVRTVSSSTKIETRYLINTSLQGHGDTYLLGGSVDTATETELGKSELELYKEKSRGRSGSIGYRLDDRGIGVWFSAGARDFFLLYRVQIGSGAHTVSCPMDTGGSFPLG